MKVNFDYIVRVDRVSSNLNELSCEKDIHLF